MFIALLLFIDMQSNRKKVKLQKASFDARRNNEGRFTIFSIQDRHAILRVIPKS